MKPAHRSFPLLLISAAVSSLSITLQTHAASALTFDSAPKVSSGGSFNLSVFPGKAGYAGLVTGTFGDGTVEAYSFWRNGAPLEKYASDGSPVLGSVTNNSTNPYALAVADVWTTNDPGTGFSGGDPANFGGSTETIAGVANVTSTVDVSAFNSGTVYVLCGGYDTPFQVELTMSGPGPAPLTATSGSIDPPPSRDTYIATFTFDNSSGDYDTISYTFSGNTASRARFMGVVVDAEVAAGALLWSGVATSNVTTTTADASATINEPLTAAVLVWDTSDQGTSSTGDWANSASLGTQAAGPVSGQLTGLSADTEYTWRFYGTDGSGEAWSGPQTLTTPLTPAQAPSFIAESVTPGTLDVTLDWTDASQTETGFTLERSDNGVDFTVIASLAPDTVQYVDTTPEPGEFTYRITAVNADNGSSAGPGQTSITVPAPLIYATPIVDVGSNFKVSLFPTKASYSGNGNTGDFGDGTVLDYRFFNNSASGFEVNGYANGGGGRVPAATAGTAYITPDNYDWGSVWTTSDPGTDFSGGDPADYTTDLVPRASDISGTIDIAGLTSGTVNVIFGLANGGTVNLTLTMSGAGQTDRDFTVTTTQIGEYIVPFFFDNPSNDYSTITYSYTGPTTSRGRFMGVILDGESTGGPSSPYDTWIAGFDFSGFTSPDLTATGNPDSDQHENLLEFAFGFDPTVSDGGAPLAISGGAISQNGPPQIHVDAGTGQFFLRYTRRSDFVAAGLTYTPQFAADSLGTGAFEDVTGGSVVATGTGAGGVVIEAVAIEFPDALPISGKKARFGRVEVTQAP